MIEYFNYSTIIAERSWQRRSFLRAWWSIYSSDKRWAPPDFIHLFQDLNASHLYLAEHRPLLLSLEAMSRATHHHTDVYGSYPPISMTELWVACAVGLINPKREDGSAYLGLLHCINHEETMERLIGALLEQVGECGAFRLLGPTWFSPHHPLTGVLCSHFDRNPPFNTPYNPPYLPDLLEQVMEPVLEMRLYTIEIERAITQGEADKTVTISPFDVRRLSIDLLPLFQSAYADHPEFPIPDEAEASYLVQNWLRTPLIGLLAQIDQQAVGFVLLQPDLNTLFRRTNGGRNPLLRPWLRWGIHRRVKAGRLLTSAVHPEWRGQGIARQLWQATYQAARQQGWYSLSIGPVIEDSDAAGFLKAMGARAEQRYRLYTSSEGVKG